MLKKSAAAVPVLLALILLASCGGVIVDLPDDPAIFEMTEREGVDTVVLVHGNDEYVPYGLIRGKRLDLTYAFGDCIGYVSGDKNDRVFTMKGEDPAEWLINYYVNGVMDVPVVLRRLSSAQSGAGAIPDCVDPTWEK